jgi:hypothetical protein
MENNVEESGLQIIESTGVDVFEAQERAAIDIQITTAKRYPRNLMRVKDNSISIVSMNMEVAQSCRYAKPIGTGKVSGPSVHLARILCQQYGNIRVQQRIKQVTDKTIVAEAVAFDLETNYAVAVEARKSIIGRDGRRFTESVIETNAMAILAIAERNAILKIIPKAITDTVYKAAFDFANGDLSDEQKILAARKKMLDFFAEKYDATEDQVLKTIGLRSVGQIKSEHIADLRAFAQSLKDGDITADELFGKKQESAINPLKDKRSKQAENKTEDNPEKPLTEVFK